jgi:hypothetical protein
VVLALGCGQCVIASAMPGQCAQSSRSAIHNRRCGATNRRCIATLNALTYPLKLPSFTHSVQGFT